MALFTASVYTELGIRQKIHGVAMRFGMLIIGSELLQGKQLEANLHFLGGFLRTYHFEVSLALTVSDKQPLILSGLEELYRHCDTVIVCGGLGPTPDDITKETLAKFFSKQIKFSPQSHSVALENYTRMGKTYPADHTYSQLPEDFIALPNHAGFAPGLWIQTETKAMLALPGVPREFRSMLELHLPKLVKLESEQKFNLVTVRTKGIPEEKIFNELCPELWKSLETYGEVSSLPQMMGVDVGVKTTSAPERIYELISSSKLADYVWSYGFKSIEQAIMDLALEKKKTIGFAESCTGGLCAHRMTNLSGVSQIFWGSVVCYDNSVKEKILGVKTETLKNFGAVSEECAQEMALGSQKALGVDIAVSLTGIAGPGGGTPQKPVGTVCIGLAFNDKVRSKIFNFKGDRENLKERFSQAAMYLLWEVLTENS